MTLRPNPHQSQCRPAHASHVAGHGGFSMTTTSACPGLPEMVRLVSGETDLAELERLHDHVRGCEVCQQTMRRLRLGEALGQLLQSDGLRMEPADLLRARELLRGL